MEATKHKANSVQISNKEDAGKAIRISAKHRKIIEDGKKEINKDSTYKKKISVTRYIEKLIEDYWEKPISDLQKEREGAKDWLEIEYKKENPGMSFFEWLRLRVEGKSKKSAKTIQSVSVKC